MSRKGYDVEKNLMDVDGATQALRQFADERDWQPFH